MDTVEILRKMIIEEFELEEDKVQPDTDLTTLGIDSLSVIEFIFKVEDEFKVVFPDRRVADAQDLKTASPGKTIAELAAVLDVLLADQKTQSNPVGSAT